MRTKVLFDDGWAFHLGADIKAPRRLVGKAGTANGWSDLTEEELVKYNAPRTGIEKMGPAFQAIQLRPHDSDASWVAVRLPHDWRIEQLPSPSHSYPADYPKAWQGLWPTSVAYYRKVFDASPILPGQRVEITFDAIAGLGDVWLNGFWLGQQTTSYTPLTLDVTELLRFDIPNVLLVRTDSSEAEGWWLEGGGIYRHTWMETFGEVRIARDGMYVTTPHVSEQSASVHLEIEVSNTGIDNTEMTVELLFTDPGGHDVNVAPTDSNLSFAVPAMSKHIVHKKSVLEKPYLWNLAKGHLYTLTARLIRAQSHESVDAVTVDFGVRKIEWEQDGIFVNGAKTKIQGVNLHQDFGYYGSALPDRIIEAKLDMCAEMGANAIRVAHHAPNPEMVRHADRIGMLIMPEQRNMSTSAASVEQLRRMVRAFRSSPSILMWSLENEEISLQGTPLGSAILARLIRECKTLDPTRMVTLGGVARLDDKSSGYYQQVNVLGMHYRCLFGNLDESLSLYPNQLHVLDEEGLFACTRGVYHYDRAGAYSGSFSYIHEALRDRDDPTASAAIGDIDPRKFSPVIAPNLTRAFSHPKVTGAFIWTGIDYYGEPSPARWPAIVGAYGQRDIAGLPKDYYWLVRSIFKKSEPVVHGFPHWTWPGAEGQTLAFAVYTNCDEVEVEINGTIISGGRWPVINHKAQQPQGVTYHPGNICVRGFRKGIAVAEHVQETAGAPSALKVVIDRKVLNASERDVALVRVSAVDAEGRFVPDATDVVHISASRAGRVAGLCNGDTTFTTYIRAVDKIALFHGQAVAFVEAGEEEGQVEIVASSHGLQDARATISVSKEHGIGRGLEPPLDERQVSVYGIHRSA
ncbi:glycoside hydrolase superfamily [Aspergillus pseudoustus]|uniref:Glycoside hydrolase superfamily n=1 Tax=Aspergillus pseudoustus TaxID=1810923 RepID=A0ABR4K2Y4_9EURO